MKNREIDNIITSIGEYYGENYDSDKFNDLIDRLSFSNNVCIEIIDNASLLYSSNSKIRGC